MLAYNVFWETECILLRSGERHIEFGKKESPWVRGRKCGRRAPVRLMDDPGRRGRETNCLTFVLVRSCIIKVMNNRRFRKKFVNTINLSLATHNVSPIHRRRIPVSSRNTLFIFKRVLQKILATCVFLIGKAMLKTEKKKTRISSKSPLAPSRHRTKSITLHEEQLKPYFSTCDEGIEV